MAELPTPIRIDPERLIEQVFPLLNDPNVPDNASQAVAGHYLMERYAGPPPEGSDPSVVRIPVVVPQTRLGTHWGWPRTEGPHDFPHPTFPLRWSKEEGRAPYRWARALLAANLLANVVVNVDQVPNLVRDGIEGLQVAKDTVEDRLLHTGRHKVSHTTFSFHPEQETTPGGPLTNDKFLPSKVGESAPTPSAINQFFAELKELQSKGAVINKARLLGESSDEWRSNPDCDFQVVSGDNITLAAERAQEFKNAITAEAAARGVQLPELEVVNLDPKPGDLDQAEKLLSPEERVVAESTAQQFGFPDFCTATAAYGKDRDSLPPVLRAFIDTRIGEHRGTSLILQGQIGDQTIDVLVPDVRHFVTNEPDGSPNKKHEYDLDWLIVPIIPIPAGHKRPGAKTAWKEKIIPGVEGDDEWLRIYKEGANPDMTLRKDVWAYTRKYQAMLREGRIKNVYSFDYVDSAGAPQTMRVLYADHTPTFEAATNFGIALQSIVQMRGGNIGHNLDAIVVYPEDNAGTAGNSPKQIGLGIDYQQERDTLGMAYYSLGLVEMHMPTDPTTEYMQDFYGALMTFSHENGGHFIDHNQQPARLRSIDDRLQRHFIVSDQRADFGRTEYDRLLALDRGATPRRRIRDIVLRRPPESTDRRWWTRQGLQTINGTTRTMEHDNLIDQELRDHRWPLLTRIQNRFPTSYSHTSSSELWADSVAQAVTGIGIPFTEQGIFRNPPSDPDFARSYAIGTRTLQIIQRTVGSDQTSDGIEWPNQREAAKNWMHQMTTVENDPHLEPLARQARTWDFRRPDDPRVWHILARARRSQHK